MFFFQRRRIEVAPSPVVTASRPGAAIITRPGMPASQMQRLPIPARPSVEFSQKPRVIPVPAAPGGVPHSQTRKQPLAPQDSKYEEYSDVRNPLLCVL